MESKIKRVAAIHDLSCFGRSSLTVVMPLLAKMNIQGCPLPTALLSTHGAFKGGTYLDLTSQMSPIINHWNSLDLEFDGIYSGFLGSSDQIDIVIDFIDKFKNNETLVVVDPVMGDNGKVYSIIDSGISKRMVDLVSKADIITPNITEASVLLNREYRSSYTREDLSEILEKLSDLGPKIVVLTSVTFNNSPKKYTAVYSRSTGEVVIDSCDYIPEDFPGTGDAFTTLFLGGLLQGKTLTESLKMSLAFIESSLKTSISIGVDPKEGIILELPIV